MAGYRGVGLIVPFVLVYLSVCQSVFVPSVYRFCTIFVTVPLYYGTGGYGTVCVCLYRFVRDVTRVYHFCNFFLVLETGMVKCTVYVIQ